MAEQTQASFSGWAVLELFGHQKEIGFVTTEYFGGPALFRVDQPEMDAREYELKRPEWIAGTMAPTGSKVQREALPGKTVYVGPSSIFRMTPCSEDTARRAIEEMIPVPVKVLHLAERGALTDGSVIDNDDDDDDDDSPF